MVTAYNPVLGSQHANANVTNFVGMLANIARTQERSPPRNLCHGRATFWICLMTFAFVSWVVRIEYDAQSWVHQLYQVYQPLFSTRPYCTMDGKSWKRQGMLSLLDVQVKAREALELVDSLRVTHI